MIYLDHNADLFAKLPQIRRKATAIALLIFLFIAVFHVEPSLKAVDSPEIQQVIQIEDIPITRQIVKTPPPPRSRLAEVIEAQDPDEVDTTILIADNTDIAQPLPELPAQDDDDEIYTFFAVEKQPQILKHVTPEYPELARLSEVEAQLIVQIVIGKDGKVESAEILGVRPEAAEGYFEEAALNAARKFEFTPAEQRGKPVRVTRNLPFRFSM